MKPKLITDIRSTNKRGWIEHQLQVNKVMEWIAANLPDTVAFNDSAAFGTDEDYLLFKMKWSKTCDWREEAYEAVNYGEDAVSIGIDLAASNIPLIKVTRI